MVENRAAGTVHDMKTIVQYAAAIILSVAGLFLAATTETSRFVVFGVFLVAVLNFSAAGDTTPKPARRVQREQREPLLD